MHDISGLIAWAEKRYSTKAPKIAWSPMLLLFHPDKVAEGGWYPYSKLIVISREASCPELVFLHEWHHFLGEADEDKTDARAKKDHYDYVCEKMRAFEKKMDEEEKIKPWSGRSKVVGHSLSADDSAVGS